MSITVSGLGSGLDYDSWIDALVAIKQKDIDAVSTQVTNVKTEQSTLNTLEKDYKSLQTAIKTFTNALSTEDVFNQKTATSSSDAVSASVTTSATSQSLSVSVSQLATSTVAKSASTAAAYLSSTTKLSSLSSGSFEAGTFSVYVNGTKNSITLTSDETVDDVLSSLNSITGVSASLSNDGKLTIASSDSSTYSVTVGSSSDTSNLTDLMSLTLSNGTYSSSKSIFTTNTADALTSSGEFAAGTITAGTFTIGSTSFTIDSSTTLDSIISSINSSSAGVTASWDSNAGKMFLTSSSCGAVNINITAGDGTVGDTDASNFTDIMGLTTSTWDSDGNLASTALNTSSQTLGTNAILTVNGTQITSSSNTVTSATTGLTGVTLTLNSTTSSAATVAVTTDTSKITSALESVITAFNTAISATDTATATDGDLYGETILKSLRNNIRREATAAISGLGSYTNLADIGITTGDYTTDTSASTSTLQLDSTKLASALASDPDSVKALLVGHGTTDGVFDTLNTTLTNSLNSTSGFFTTKDTTYDSKISTLNKKITKMTTALTKYKESLETKFQAMDTLISNLKKSATVFDSYFNNDSSDDDS